MPFPTIFSFLKIFTMLHVKLLLFTIISLFSTAAVAQTDSLSFKVAGNCGMCKKRIETAIKDPAVSSASWNVKSKLLSVIFDSSQTTAEKLQKRVAAAGHDTERVPADQSVYDKLPGCCRYERLKDLNTAAKQSVQ